MGEHRLNILLSGSLNIYIHVFYAFNFSLVEIFHNNVLHKQLELICSLLCMLIEFSF